MSRSSTRRVAVTISDDSQGWLLDAGASADHVILNIELGGDSFLSSVLPPSLRIDTADRAWGSIPGAGST